ncbi:hypothetical protein ZWY2020_022737 [Hordeum vulgare]|nr:hypothetical protein ZWY2020_022737 [Hordeum vulgare]
MDRRSAPQRRAVPILWGPPLQSWQLDHEDAGCPLLGSHAGPLATSTNRTIARPPSTGAAIRLRDNQQWISSSSLVRLCARSDHIAPPKGPNNGHGGQGPRRRKQPRFPATTISTQAGPAHDDGPSCFNCGLPSHFQVACPNPPTCYLYKDAGHPAILCPNRLVCEELMVYMDTTNN